MYKIKHKEGSTKPIYKARLVVKGFKQKKGLNFDEIFFLVMKMYSSRVVLTLAASLDLEVEHLDVKTTFPHSDLEEIIYIKQSKGFEVKGKEHMICKLKKSLYNLKQALRQWYVKFDSFVENNEYKKSISDHCVFIKRFDVGDFIVLLLCG